MGYGDFIETAKSGDGGVDGSKLLDLMHKYNVGVQTKSVYEVKAVDNDFFESEDI